MDSHSGTLLQFILLGSIGPFPAAASISSDGSLVLTGERSGIARIWNVATGEVVRTLETQDGIVSSVALSPNGKIAALVIAPTGQVTLWDVETASLRRTMALPSLPDGGHNGGHHASIAVAPNGRLVAVGTTDIGGSGGLDLFDMEAGIHLRHFVGGWNSEAPEGANGVTFSPDGLSLFSLYDESVKQWDIRDIVSRPRFVRSADRTEIHWDLGTLQFAPTLNGPWTDLPAASPFWLSSIGGQGFFRIKARE